MCKIGNFWLSSFTFFALGLNVGCGTKKNNEIRYVMPPKWVLGYNTNEDFSAIGVIPVNSNLPLTEIITRAESNAVENLQADVLMKFENCFIDASTDLSLSNRNEAVKKLNTITDDAFKNNVLKDISRRDEFWVSPDNNVAYLMVSGDSKNIVKTFINELNGNIVKYKNNPEMMSFISKVKSNVLNGTCFRKANNEGKTSIHGRNIKNSK